MARGTSKPGSRGIKRQSLPETLAESLRERILNGEFREGDALIQESIAAEYEVSRMPVREALRQLEASGLVELKTHKGAVVTSLPAEQIEELFEMRALLECDLLNHSLPKMTDAGIEVSRGILDELEAAYRRRDVGQWGALNWAFHRSLYAPSGRVQTLAVVQGINVQTDRYIRLQLLLTGGVADAENEHREILRLCAARDPKGSVKYMRGHIIRAGQNLLVALAARGTQHAA